MEIPEKQGRIVHVLSAGGKCGNGDFFAHMILSGSTAGVAYFLFIIMPRCPAASAY
jgi:hypothetical protein